MNRRQYKNLKPGDKITHLLTPDKVWTVTRVNKYWCEMERRLTYGDHSTVYSSFEANRKEYFQLFTREMDALTSC